MNNQLKLLRMALSAAVKTDRRFHHEPDAGLKPWLCEILSRAPDQFSAIIQATNGKLYEVPVNIAFSNVTLGDTAREVIRETKYLPLEDFFADGKSVALQARDFASEVRDASDRWMFAPGGVHTITPQAGDGSAEVTIKIDPETATVLQASLEQLNTRNNPQRAFFDKEHDATAGATAWPKRFLWSETPAPGIYCEHEPSQFGIDLVKGHVVRAFSPSFYCDAELPRKLTRGQHVKIQSGKRGSPENPARMTGLVFPACGTLTNNPAFRKILPLFGKDAPGAKSR